MNVHLNIYKQFISIILSISLVGTSITSSLAQHFSLAVPGVRTLKLPLVEHITFPLEPGFISRQYPETVTCKVKTSFLIEHLFNAMKAPGGLNIFQDLKRKVKSTYALGRINIACIGFKGFDNLYTYCILLDGEIIGHGIIHYIADQNLVEFCYQIYDSFQGRDYGTEALVLIMAMGGNGHLFGYVPIDYFGLSEPTSERIPAGLKDLKRFLRKAGFDKNYRFCMKYREKISQPDSLAKLRPTFNKFIYIKDLVVELREQVNELQYLWEMLVLTRLGERGVLYKKYVIQLQKIMQLIDNKYKEKILNRIEEVAIFHTLKNDISLLHAIKNEGKAILRENDNLLEWKITKIVDRAFEEIFNILLEYSQIKFPINKKIFFVEKSAVKISDTMQSPLFLLSLHLNSLQNLSTKLWERLVAPGEYSNEEMDTKIQQLFELILTLLKYGDLCRSEPKAFEIIEKALVSVSRKFSSVSTRLPDKYNLGQKVQNACEYSLTQLQAAMITKKNNRLEHHKNHNRDILESK